MAENERVSTLDLFTLRRERKNLLRKCYKHSIMYLRKHDKMGCLLRNNMVNKSRTIGARN